MNMNRNKFNRERWDKYSTNRWIRYSVPSIVAGAFMAFVVGWVFLIPAAVAGLLVYGFVVYMRERKHRIIVTIKPTEAMKALARREEELKRERERILYEAGIK